MMLRKGRTRQREEREKEDEPADVAEEAKWRWTDGIDDDLQPSKTQDKIVHTSIRHGQTQFAVGDTVQVRGQTSYKWIGLVRGFERDYDYSRGEQKRAIVIWFLRQQDFANRTRRKNNHPGEIYLSNYESSIPVQSIIKCAKIYSTQEEYKANYSKWATQNPDRHAVYVCPKAGHEKKGLFFDFDWSEHYRHADTDFDGIVKYIGEQIEAASKPRPKRKRVRKDETYEEEYEDDEIEELSTPKKKRKIEASTPKRQSVTTASTPVSSRVKKALQITPLPMRTLPSSLLESPYKLAQATLHVSAVPTSLPCREEEYNEILEHLEAAIEEGTGCCIYISGVPGTGKTATVREVIRALNEQVDAGELDDFRFVEINGLKVLDPNQAYAMLWEALTGERVTPSHAASLLDSHFKRSGPGRVPCVVLLDELDQLVMAKQTVLYNLFNWPTLPNSRLIVVAIANTMNLADMLPNKIQSRVGLTRVNFEPYTKEQLIRIIESRLETVPGNIVEKDAITLCAMRITNNTGDARKALDVCRRAVELAETEANTVLPDTPTKRPVNTQSTKGKVTTGLVQSVLQEFFRHPVQSALKYLPFTSKLLLAALLLRTRRVSGKSSVTFGDVIEEATRICMSAVNNPQAKVLMNGVVTPRGLERAGVELEMCKIIDWEEKGGRRGGRVGLQISEEDLKMAFQQDQAWKDMIK